MEYTFIGAVNTDWSGHGEYQKGIDPALQNCPFCASDDLTVSNSWTPYYSVECECCGASVPGDFTPPEGMTGAIADKDECLRIHEAAFLSAIECWNTRLDEESTS